MLLKNLQQDSQSPYGSSEENNLSNNNETATQANSNPAESTAQPQAAAEANQGENAAVE